MFGKKINLHILAGGLFSSAAYGHDRDCCDTISEYFLSREVLIDSNDPSAVIDGGMVEFSQPVPIEQFLAERADTLDAESVLMLESMLEESQMGYADQFRGSAHEFGSDSIFEVGEIPGVEIGDFEFEFLPLDELKSRGDFLNSILPLDQVEMESYDLFEMALPSSQAPANLLIWDLLVSSRPPLSFDEWHTFSFALYNMGDGPAHNTRLRVFLDGEFVFSNDMGTWPARDGVIVLFPLRVLRGEPGGLRELSITITTSSPQTNLDHNRVSGWFLWRPTVPPVPIPQFVDLRVTQFESHNPQPLHAFVRQGFDTIIANSGNVAASPYVYLSINGTTKASGNLPSIPSGNVMTVTFSSIMLGGTGFFDFGVRVRERTRPDINLHHNSLQRTFPVHADGCGLWAWRLVGNTRNITLLVDDHRIVPYLSVVQDAAADWNGISSNVHFSAVGINIINPTARITTDIMRHYEEFAASENGLGHFTYTSGTIAINRERWAWPADVPVDIPTDVWRRIVLRHEIGHLLGLYHPNESHDQDNHPVVHNLDCRYPAVMQTIRERPEFTAFISDRITNHDIHALINRFGP